MIHFRATHLTVTVTHFMVTVTHFTVTVTHFTVTRRVLSAVCRGHEVSRARKRETACVCALVDTEHIGREERLLKQCPLVLEAFRRDYKMIQLPHTATSILQEALNKITVNLQNQRRNAACKQKILI